MGVHRLTHGRHVVQGTAAGHPQGSPNADAARVIEAAEEGAVLLLIADGAGSAARGREAAHCAVTAAAAHATNHWPSTGEALEACVAAAQSAVAVAQAGENPSDWGCTLLAVAWNPRGQCLGVSVGDSWATYWNGERWLAPLERHQGIYEGETRFLLGSQPSEWSQGEWLLADAHSMFLLTDGLDPMAYDRLADQPFAPFFRGLEAALAASEQPAEDLVAFLASNRIARRSGDDRTVIWLSPTAST